MPRTSSTDYLLSYGAGVLAATVQAYWHKQGATHVRAERYETDIPGVFGVRSNLVCGLPPDSP